MPNVIRYDDPRVLAAVEIDEAKAAHIVECTGLPLEDGYALTGHRLGRLNEYLVEFLYLYRDEQVLSPSAKRDRFGLIAKRAKQLLAVLPKAAIDGEETVVPHKDFELDAYLTQGAGWPGGISSLVGQLKSLQVAAESAEKRMEGRVVTKVTRKRHQGQVAFNSLLSEIVRIYVILFGVAPGLSRRSVNAEGMGGEPGGPLMRFVEAMLEVLKRNLAGELGEDDPLVVFLGTQRGEALMERLRQAKTAAFPDDEEDPHSG